MSLQFGVEIGDLACLLAHIEAPVADPGDARGVIPAVLEPTKTVEDNLLGISGAYIADNSTHVQKLYNLTAHLEQSRAGRNGPGRPASRPRSASRHVPDRGRVDSGGILM